MKPTDHRILYNGDCNYLFASDYRRPEDRHGPYTAQVLEDHVDLLADRGVDTFLINRTSSIPTRDRPGHPSGSSDSNSQ